MQLTIRQRLASGAVIALLLGALFIQLLGRHVNAATLNNAFVRFDRMQTSQATTVTICARPTTTASTEVDVQVSFPTGYSTSTTLGNWTVNTTNLAWPSVVAPITAVSAWPGIGTATAVSAATGGTATFPSSDLTSATTLYCFNLAQTTAVSVVGTPNPSLTGTITTRATGPTAIDTTSYATAAVSSDQIAVSATVPQTFSFAINNSADSLGSLGTGITSSPAPRTATVDTNAKNGWYVWAKDSNTGLTSAAAAYTIPSRTPGTNSTIAGGVEGYNTGVTQTQGGGTGTITVATPFVGGTSGRGGGLDTTLRTLAQSNGTASAAVLTLTNNATISTSTAAAGYYADTITVVAAGLF